MFCSDGSLTMRQREAHVVFMSTVLERCDGWTPDAQAPAHIMRLCQSSSIPSVLPCSCDCIVSRMSFEVFESQNISFPPTAAADLVKIGKIFRTCSGSVLRNERCRCPCGSILVATFGSICYRKCKSETYSFVATIMPSCFHQS